MEIEKAAGVARRGAYVRRSPELKAAIVAECLALEAVVERSGGGAAVRHLLTGEAHPFVEGIGDGSGPVLSRLSAKS